MNNTKADVTVERGSTLGHGHSVNEWFGLTPEGALLKLANNAAKGQLESLFGKFLVKVRPGEQNQQAQEQHALLKPLMDNIAGGTGSQVVFTIGQSGAGKTTSTMQLLEQLLLHAPKTYLCIENMLSVIQLFSNASTENNEDSTRCIFIINLSFHGNEICGISLAIRALEIGRVNQSIDNFHVFEDLSGGSFNPSYAPLSTVLDSDQIHRLFQCLSALSTLNTLDMNYEDNDLGTSLFLEQLQPVAQLLNCPLNELHEALTTIRSSQGEVLPVGSLKRQEKKDGFAAQLYYRLFVGILSKVNHMLRECFDHQLEATSTVALIDNAAEIVWDEMKAQTLVGCESVSRSEPTTLAVSKTLAQHIQDFTKLPGNDIERWTAKLVHVKGISQTVDISESIDVNHYLGTKSYTLARFKRANSTAVTDSVSSFISRMTAFICDPPTASAKGTDIVSATRTVMREVQALLQSADSRFVVCCIRDASDQKEMACVDLAKYTGMLFARYPYSMNLESFNERFLEIGQEGLCSKKISDLIAVKGFADNEFHLTETHIYMRDKLHTKLATVLNGPDPDASIVEDQHFDFTPGDEAELESSGEVIQRLEHEKRQLEKQVSDCHSRLNQQEADLDTKANTIDAIQRKLVKRREELHEVIAKKTKLGLEASDLRIALEQVSGSLSRQTVAADNLMAEMSRLEDTLSKQTAAATRLSVEKANIQEDLSKQTAAVRSLSEGNTMLEIKYRTELQRISDDLLKQTDAASTLLTEKGQLELQHELELAQLADKLTMQTARINNLLTEKAELQNQHQATVDQAQVRIAELVSEHHVKMNASAEKLGAEIAKHQCTGDNLEETRSLLLASIRSHALEKFFPVREDGDALSFTRRAAATLTKHLAPLQGQQGVFNAIKSGVVARARSAIPASTILPLIHTLSHPLCDAQSIQNGLSVEQWTEIRNLGIEAFQVKFVDDVSHSLHARALTIQASTIAKGIKDLIPPMIGMVDIHKVLQGPVGIILSKAMKVDNKEYPLLNKVVLMQRIEEIINAHDDMGLVWMRDSIQ